MPRWSELPRNRLLADVSLWSADLANLRASIEKMEPYADSFHIDVSDDRFVSGLLFFPDLVAAIRRYTTKPFHVHLFVERPTNLLEAFIAAGADLITVHVEVGAAELYEVFDNMKAFRREVGLALRPETPVEAVEDFLQDVSVVLLLNTPAGTKGAAQLSPTSVARIQELDQFLKRTGTRNRIRIEADGAIRKHTVPLLRQAGADVVVPGSLAFAETDPAEVFNWLRSL